ncbi:hypothetical protein EV2_006988 [Malus domestica]
MRHHSGNHSNHPRQSSWRHNHGSSRATSTFKGPSPSRVGPCRLNPMLAQYVAELSPSLAPACTTHRAVCSCSPACARGFPSSLSQPKIFSTIPASKFQTYNRAGGILIIHLFMDLIFPNLNLAPIVYHPSTAQGGTFLPSFSHPNGKEHLSRQVIELMSAFAQQTTLVNQLLQCTEIQRA